jgi:hypothetical protein
MRKVKDLIQRFVVFAKVGRFITITPHRLEMLQKAFQYVTNEKVPGEYFEFGVARGLTFSGAYHIARKYHAPTNEFYGFDSFEGFPELHEIDKKFIRFKTGDENWTQDTFSRTLQDAGVPKEVVRVVPGWFKDSLTPTLQNSLREGRVKASIVWVDCDLYESTLQVLNFITPLLQNGTVIIFDDWYCYHADPNKGERRAVREFLTSHTNIQLTEYHKFGIVGNSFIVTIS